MALRGAARAVVLAGCGGLAFTDHVVSLGVLQDAGAGPGQRQRVVVIDKLSPRLAAPHPPGTALVLRSPFDARARMAASVPRALRSDDPDWPVFQQVTRKEDSSGVGVPAQGSPACLPALTLRTWCAGKRPAGVRVCGGPPPSLRRSVHGASVAAC